MSVIGAAVVELHVPSARSLKDKRKTIKSLVERVARRYRVSIAESGFQELHQRAEITIAVVAHSESEADQRLELIRRIFEDEAEAMVTDWWQEVLILR